MGSPAKPLFPILFLWFSVLIFSLCVFSDVRKSAIRLKPDPGFGIGVDWGYYFPGDFDQTIGFLDDGSFFLASSRRNVILRFNPTGELQLEFGRSGQGPGDLTMPRDVTILDNQYVVVRERGETRRISVFNLKGEFYKLIQTNISHIACVSVGDGKIGIVTGQLNQNVRKDIVSLRDIHSGQVVPIAAFEYEVAPRSRVQIPYLYPRVHLAKIDKDKLLVGFSGNENIEIYSKEGKKLTEFSMSLSRRKIKRDEIETYLMRQADLEPNENRRVPLKKMFQESVRTLPLPDSYPAYHRLAVDSNNRIFICEHDTWLKGSSVALHIFSMTGDFIGEMLIDEGEYQPVYPHNVYQNWLYVPLRKKADDGSLSLSRVSIQ